MKFVVQQNQIFDDVLVSETLNINYDFRIQTMFGSSLPPIVCRRAHVLFMLFVIVCA